MDEYEIRIMEDVVVELSNLRNNLRQYLKSEQLSNRIYSSIILAIQLLANFPYRIKVVEDEPWKSEDYRELVIDKYKVGFIVDEFSKSVIILAIYSERQYRPIRFLQK